MWSCSRPRHAFCVFSRLRSHSLRRSITACAQPDGRRWRPSARPAGLLMYIRQQHSQMQSGRRSANCNIVGRGRLRTYGSRRSIIGGALHGRGRCAPASATTRFSSISGLQPLARSSGSPADVSPHAASHVCCGGVDTRQFSGFLPGGGRGLQLRSLRNCRLILRRIPRCR